MTKRDIYSLSLLVSVFCVIVSNALVASESALLETGDIRHIAELTDAMSAEKNDVVWLIYAEELRMHYLRKKMFPEASNTAREVFVRMRTLAAGIATAETFLAGGQIHAAMQFAGFLEKTFSKKESDKAMIEILKCRILIAQGEMGAAKKLVQKLRTSTLHTPDAMFQLARIQAATQQYASSVQTLIRCFEESPPAIAAILKENAKTSPDFKILADHPEFKVALKTRSLLPDDCPTCVRDRIRQVVY